MGTKISRFSLIGSVVVAGVMALLGVGVANAQKLPPFPAIYDGSVQAGGIPVPDGFAIFAKIGNDEIKLAIMVQILSCNSSRSNTGDPVLLRLVFKTPGLYLLVYLQ